MTMTNAAHDVEAGYEDIDVVPDSQEFESYYDHDSGAWSLRRISTAPPVPLADD